MVFVKMLSVQWANLQYVLAIHLKNDNSARAGCHGRKREELLAVLWEKITDA